MIVGNERVPLQFYDTEIYAKNESILSIMLLFELWYSVLKYFYVIKSIQ